MTRSYDLIIVGAGHAGIEAAAAADRMGAKVALITMSSDDLGRLSCNPAIGGLGKGHIVRELDALGGVMPAFADHAAIGYRLLNRRKGPAVRGPRAQVDRDLYRHAVTAWLSSSGVDLCLGEVVDLDVREGIVAGVRLRENATLFANAVILTTGTFLGGVMHIGGERNEGGRVGNRAAARLGARLRELGAPVERLKTGTPPRLDGRTIDWSRLTWQRPDETVERFSLWRDTPTAPAVSCAVARTTSVSHSIIRDHLEESATFSGAITGGGPRYCPSIEDKVTRFGDRDGHQIFLEPEALGSHLVYPNGISTALPLQAQMKFVQAIKGLEQVKIVQPGYAVEYDYLDPRALGPDLQSRLLPGLYLAGQINGTTGYEEAAGQGLVAGSHAAAAALNLETPALDRTNSYIGVMVDDLVVQGVSEPYRMFTSRAEFRLALRTDNAYRRLTPIAKAAGLATKDLTHWFDERASVYQRGRSILDETSVTASQMTHAGASVRQDGARRSLFEWLRFPDVDWHLVRSFVAELGGIDDTTAESLCVDAEYHEYLQRQLAEVEKLRANESRKLSADLDYHDMPGLSNEMAERLSAVRPQSLGAAARIAGLTPAALTVLHAHCARAA
ncbi:MAG: tRNA uridine-5-carboxymethylaminomethyl(34) synthesis enzyme MnmG [Pacificimonas sp.]